MTVEADFDVEALRQQAREIVRRLPPDAVRQLLAEILADRT